MGCLASDALPLHLLEYEWTVHYHMAFRPLTCANVALIDALELRNSEISQPLIFIDTGPLRGALLSRALLEFKSIWK